MRSYTLLLVLLFSIALASCGEKASVERSAAQPTPSASTAGGATSQPQKSLPKIVAFGDSLTAGYGLDPADAYTTLLQRKLDQDGLSYQVVNAGVSGDTSADGLRRIDWALDGNVKVVILELGGNDFLREMPVDAMKKNLAEIIDHIKGKGVQILLAGMEAPTNTGPEYRKQAHEAFASLAREKEVALIPFVLDGVGGVASLNQSDGIHPNVSGEKIMTDNVYKYLAPMLKTGS